jgi:hypothetical protein
VVSVATALGGYALVNTDPDFRAQIELNDCADLKS